MYMIYDIYVCIYIYRSIYLSIYLYIEVGCGVVCSRFLIYAYRAAQGHPAGAGVAIEAHRLVHHSASLKDLLGPVTRVKKKTWYLEGAGVTWYAASFGMLVRTLDVAKGAGAWSVRSTDMQHTLRFRGGLVFKAHRLVYHSTLGLRVIKKKKTPCSGRIILMLCYGWGGGAIVRM